MPNSPIFRHASIECALLLALLLALLSPGAQAELADRDQPVNIEADRMTADDAHKSTLFEGSVILTQGTIRLMADHMTVREDKEGFKFATALGNPVTFHQKREGANEWVRGSAQRAEYNSKKDLIELFENAVVHQDKDEIKGDYLSYDTKSELLQAHGHSNSIAPAALNNSPSGRVHVTLQPAKRAPVSPGTGEPSPQPSGSSTPAPAPVPGLGVTPPSSVKP